MILKMGIIVQHFHFGFQFKLNFGKILLNLFLYF